MKSLLEFKFTPNNDWSLVSFINNQKIYEYKGIPEIINIEFDIQDYNILMFLITKNNIEANGFKLLNFNFNHLDATNMLSESELLSSHPNYGKCIPCTDFNLSGAWFFRFRENFGNSIIRKNINV